MPDNEHIARIRAALRTHYTETETDGLMAQCPPRTGGCTVATAADLVGRSIAWTRIIARRHQLGTVVPVAHGVRVYTDADVWALRQILARARRGRPRKAVSA